mgnify:CR=1 FL=1
MIPYINIGNPSIPNVGIGGVRNINVYMANVRELDIPENRVWLYSESESVPPDVPVVVNIGKPIVDMPGCVTVHKENLKQRSKNKMLVNDDPKGNTTLCDSGMPSFQPVDYQSQGLTWTTVVPEEPEPDGMNSEPPPEPDITTPSPEIPPTGGIETEKECPGPNDLRVGDYTTSGDEKVSGHEWNADETICITLYEDVGFVEKYLPSPQIVTTTATIAVVATSSALLAKPLADLLLKVIKPLVKKISAKVKKVLGKTDPVLSVQERQEQQRDRTQAIRTLKKALNQKK